MAYDGKIMRLALQEFEKDKNAREAELRDRRERIFQKQPRLRQIEGELHSTMSRIISGALRRGTDPRPAIAALRDENLSLQAEKRELLERMGLPENCLEETPVCSRCGDTGYRDGHVCRCLRRYYAREQKKELSRMLDLGGQSFDTFDLDWYSDQLLPGQSKSEREQMEGKVYETCVAFAHQFGRRAENLLLFGAPGLGKTHLSAAIARDVSDKGFSVVYDTASHVFERFETQKFGGREDQETAADVERVLNCDLLILDDLGSELTTQFVQSALYELLNTRLVGEKHTVISSNLTMEEAARRYSPQIASRLMGEYHVLHFFGDDIRLLKKNQF